MSEIEARLGAMGIKLPQAAAPAANYVPFKMLGNTLFTSGQLPFKNGALPAIGKVGADVDVDRATEAAKYCAINILSVAKLALGDLDKIRQLVKITIFVASAPDFTRQHIVGNGASDFLVEALGDKGRHARSAVGVPALPMDAPVEIEAIIET